MLSSSSIVQILGFKPVTERKIGKYSHIEIHIDHIHILTINLSVNSFCGICEPEFEIGMKLNPQLNPTLSLTTNDVSFVHLNPKMVVLELIVGPKIRSDYVRAELIRLALTEVCEIAVKVMMDSGRDSSLTLIRD